MLGILADFDPAKHRVHVEDLQEIDKYMYHKLQVFLEKVKNAYEQFDYATVYHEIHDYCSIDLSSFYLDFAKDVLYIEAEDNERRRSIQTVIYDSAMTIVKLLTPIIPHTAEEIWSHLPGEKEDRKSTRLNSSHVAISYAVFCLKK